MISRFRFAATMAALAASAVSPLSAQDVRLGAKGGIVSSTTYGDAVDDAGSLTRFSVGAFAEFGITPLLSIQPELLYTLKGGRALGEDAGDLRLGYVEIPLLAKLTFQPTRVRLSIFAGPALAIKTSCEVEFVEVAEPVECGNPDADVLDVKSTDFGAVLGAGLEYGLGAAAFLVDGRFNLGLSSIADSEELDFDVRNRAFSLLVGLSFPLGMGS